MLRDLALTVSLMASASAVSSSLTIAWDTTLPALPRPLSGHVAGISDGTLIVAGGSDFPVPLFQGGQKAWFADVYALPAGGSAWVRQAPLPRPLGYAAVVSIADGVVVAGGSDGTQHATDAFVLRWANGAVQRDPLPRLPAPIANAGAAAIGRTIFVVGGQETPAATRALNTVWALDLEASPRRWQARTPLPGAGRILPVVVAQAGKLIVVSGAELIAKADGSAGRRYLTDGFASQQDAWQPIAAPPRPVVAAPAIAWGASQVLVFGGDDGEHADRIQELRDAHPGFSRTVLAYDVAANAWMPIGTLPASLVTTTAVRRGETVILPGGEDRPGHRAADVRVGAISSSASAR